MIKRFFVVFFFLTSSFSFALAQGGMTDSQVMEYVTQQRKNGATQSEIVSGLVRKGVSLDQIRRIRDKYEKEQNGEFVGRKGDDAASIKRTRESNTDYSQRKGQHQLKVDVNSMSTTEKENYRQSQNEEMEESLSFLMADSVVVEHPKSKIFGHDIFNKDRLSFEPNMNIPTPSNYRLGPGDEVFVDIWGASQKNISTTISPEGTIQVENVGPISLSGLTIREANARAKNLIGRVYGSSQVSLTVGQTRSIMVNVMGEVVAPGTYTLSAFSTVFHALYMAGGTNEIGTLRAIKVYRNNRLISTVDVYDYILNGRLTGDVTLSDNDVIVVGPYDCLVNITGKVKRPMYYEMKKNESLATLLRYAGNFTGDAYKKNINVVRKSEGDYSIHTIGEFNFSSFHLSDGDSVSVDSAVTKYRNMVEIKGAVMRPGKYQMDGSITTVRALLECAEGLSDDAFVNRAVMHRKKTDNSLEVLSVDVAGILNGTSPDIALRNEDVLFVPSNKDLTDSKTIAIHGEVIYPGVYQYADNETLEDFILQAGGLTEAASTVKVDVARRINNPQATTSNNEIAQTFSFALKDGFVVDGEQGFVLQPFDEVYVRKSPAYQVQKNVRIEGEIMFEGVYALTHKNQRISDLIAKAGGVTNDAYIKGARLERNMTPDEMARRRSVLQLSTSAADSLALKNLDLSNIYTVGIRLDQALAHPKSNDDVELQEGDRIVIPQMNNTVKVNGAVMFPNSTSFVKGKGWKYYIDQAGGFGMNAKKNYVFVINMNGTVERASKVKTIEPGSEIVVPVKLQKKGLSTAEIMSIGTSTTSIAALIMSIFK